MNHFLVSSEPVLGENVWLPVAPGAIVGVDAGMNLHMHGDDRRRLPLAVA